MNHRETVSNVKLVTTSLMLYRGNFLSIKDIRAGINAFTLIEKELKETNIPLKVEWI